MDEKISEMKCVHSGWLDCECGAPVKHDTVMLGMRDCAPESSRGWREKFAETVKAG